MLVKNKKKNIRKIMIVPIERNRVVHLIGRRELNSKKKLGDISFHS